MFMNKIKTVSFYVARFFDFLVIALPIFIILQFMFFGTELYLALIYVMEPTSVATLPDFEVAWTPMTRFIGCASQLVEGFLISSIFYLLAKIFHAYELGQIFTINNARYYYRIGQLLFFDALLIKPISQALWTFAITCNNPAGQRFIRVSLGTPHVFAMLLGLLVILISWVMIEGSRIQEEQQLVI